VHVPFAPGAPQPAQTLPTVLTYGSAHASVEPHEPGTVEQPVAALHAGVQHAFVGPTVHAVGAAVQAQATHAPDPLHRLVHAGG
jgi:hypothetical protein